MRSTRILRNRVAAKRVLAQLPTMIPQQGDQPDVFYATSGTSETSLAYQPYMPHDNRPAVGFRAAP